MEASSNLLSDAGKLCSEVGIYENCCLNAPFLRCLVTSFKLEMTWTWQELCEYMLVLQTPGV